MSTAPARKIPEPYWLHLPPDQWPAEARIAYTILATAAKRRLAAESAQRAGKEPTSANPVEVAPRSPNFYDFPARRSEVKLADYDPAPTRALIRQEGEDESGLWRRWKEICDLLPRELREVAARADSRSTISDTAVWLDKPLTTMWDLALKAHGAVLKIACLPVVNQELERQLKKRCLWPEEATPFPGDISEVILHLPTPIRTSVYAALSFCLDDKDLAPFGIQCSTYVSRRRIATRVLHLQAQGWGTMPGAGQELDLWEAAEAFGLSAGMLADAAENAGIHCADSIRLADFPRLWTAIHSSDARAQTA